MQHPYKVNTIVKIIASNANQNIIPKSYERNINGFIIIL